ncbi:penicillin-binding transpeptidase domain-containing protein [Kitasatospora sp. NPDC059571]|uniref:penicillin-binding transpeptidase domain-containing protein n=1 Tax=Kitasatospora sp. NPDC059571 TaxID=3346871 RepID=UPI0036B80E4D
MHKGIRIGIATVVAGMVAVGGYGAYNLASALTGGSTAKHSDPPKVIDQPPTAQQAADAEKAFLDAWAKGDLEAAGALTDQPFEANAQLAAFREKVKPSAITLTPSAGGASAPATAPAAAPSSPGRPVPLTFTAKLEFAGGAPWTYTGSLGVVKMSNGKAVVQWAPSVIHPELTTAKTLAVRPFSAPPSGITDRHGKPLASFPSLVPIVSGFKPSADTDPADAGRAVVLANADQSGTPKRLFTITEAKPGPAVKLTIDAALQQAAEDAVKEQSNGGKRAASVVAVEPSTGNILAVANSPVGGNRAFTGTTAPGSTMKVVTAAALLEAGVTPNTPIACPASTTAGGQKVVNDFTEAHPDWVFKQDFAESCNTAFINTGHDKLQPDSLPRIAKEVFGLGLEWHTGSTNFDTDIPTVSNINAELPEFIGQGAIRTNSLAMASVAATVQNGTFHQPVLVAGATDGLATAQRKLSPSVLTALRSMMVLTATDGTAAAPMRGISGVGAKTGTAEVDGQGTHAWFTSYRGDLAVAAEVENGDHGASTAGPAAAKLLRIGN